MDLTGVEANLDLGSYNGFTFMNIGALDTVKYNPTYSTDSGYNNAAISSPNVAFVLNGVIGSISSATPFSFYGAYFTAPWLNDLSVEIKGYLLNTEVYSQTITISSTASFFFLADWNNIDKITFEGSGGTDAGYSYQGRLKIFFFSIFFG